MSIEKGRVKKVDFIFDNLNIIVGNNLFVLGTSLFSILIFGIKVFSVVYVFCDAPSKKQNRWLWAFATMVVPYNVGFLVYLSICWIKQDKSIEIDKIQKDNKNFSKALKISLLLLILIGIVLGLSYKLAVKAIEDHMQSFNFQSDKAILQDIDGLSGPISKFVANEIRDDKPNEIIYYDKKTNKKTDKSIEKNNKNIELIQGTNKVSGKIYGNNDYFERELWFQEDGQINIMSESELDSGKIAISLCEYNGDELISWSLDETVRNAEIDTLNAEANKIYIIKAKFEENPKGTFNIEWSRKEEI